MKYVKKGSEVRMDKKIIDIHLDRIKSDLDLAERILELKMKISDKDKKEACWLIKDLFELSCKYNDLRLILNIYDIDGYGALKEQVKELKEKSKKLESQVSELMKEVSEVVK